MSIAAHMLHIHSFCLIIALLLIIAAGKRGHPCLLFSPSPFSRFSVILRLHFSLSGSYSRIQYGAVITITFVEYSVLEYSFR